MDNPDIWRWVWLTAAVLFAVGEITTGGLFLLPFAIGAVAALALSLTGLPLWVQMAAFLAVSIATFASFRPLARRLTDDGETEGIGAKRLVGTTGIVTETIHRDGAGEVRIERELWRASAPDDATIEGGTKVRVLEMRGTRVVVEPADQADEIPQIGD